MPSAPHTAAPWQLAHMMPDAYACACGAPFTAPCHLARHIIPERARHTATELGIHHWVAPADPDPIGVAGCPVTSVST